MDFTFKRKYTGNIKAIVMDMSGTIVDFGSRAPAGAFVELFKRNNVEISQAEAREPMGLQKKDHIRALTKIPSIAARCAKVNGAAPVEEDVDRMYEEFIPIQLEIIPQYCRLIPGAAEAMEKMRSMGIRIATTTGYSTDMMNLVISELEKQGVKLDASVCASDVPAGRPAPWMIFLAMQKLGIYPPEAVVKTGDTIPDIEAGLNAGVWNIGLAKSGNMIGMSEEGMGNADPAVLKVLLERAYKDMHRAGSQFVVDSIADCPATIEKINELLSGGNRP